MPCILLVDDDAAFRATSSAMLRHDGYEVTDAASVSSGCSAITTRVPQAMLLDWKLPDGTGLDVLLWLQSRKLRVPTALVTGFWADHEFEDAMSAAKDLGVVACVRRGIDVAEPTAVVRRILDSLVDVHAEALRGSQRARESFTATLLHNVVPHLQARFGHSCAESALDAVTDAIVQHLQDPAQFDPVRYGSIEGFIHIRARRTLWNALRSMRRDAARDAEYARLRAGNSATGPAAARSAGHRLIQQSLDCEQDDRVRSALREWLAGEHGPSPWMAIPSLVQLAPDERPREIKRQKDRFVARVKRLSRLDPIRRRN